jgi:hypothetical protein
MVYTSSLSSAVDNSAVDNCSFGDSFARRYRNLDVGYILSGVGILWVLSIAAALAVPKSSLPNCQLTVLGDVAGCEAPDLSPPGLNIAEIPVPAGISPVAYDTY